MHPRHNPLYVKKTPDFFLFRADKE